MATAVNFLPWREARRRQRLRVGLLYAVGLLLALLTVVQVNRAERRTGETLAAVRLVAENQLSSALRQHESMMLERQQQAERRRLRRQSRALTEAWQSRLRAVAAQLPEQAWLTQLEYQRDTLMLSGLALNLHAVARLEEVLGRVAGFKPAKAGEMRRGDQGRWQFRFSLAGDRIDAGTH